MMTEDNFVTGKTLVADIPAFRFVGHDGNVPSSGKHALGITKFSEITGNHATILYGKGTARIELAENVVAGDEIAVGATGKGRKAVGLTGIDWANRVPGDIVMAIAEVSGSTGDAIPCRLLHGYQKS